MPSTSKTLLTFAFSLTEILEWECFCYNTEEECKRNQNGVAFGNFKVLLDDHSCRSINLNCNNRQLHSWKLVSHITDTRLFFYSNEYCAVPDDQEYYLYSDCAVYSKDSDYEMDMIGCYVVNSPAETSTTPGHTYEP